jgi:hypothetical protein
MSPYWRRSNYACPDCESRLEFAGGPDGLGAYRCSCGWSKVFDPAADEFAVSELDRYVDTEIESNGGGSGA